MKMRKMYVSIEERR